jgi:predicted MPP superfamily phosphohydrolase
MHLRLDKDNKFRIMQLTDLHFAEDRNRDLQTINMIKEIIRKEDPDFIAITGDLVSG